MDDRIDRLEREIDALRTEINELRTASPRDRDVARPPDEGGSKRTRRAMITGAAAAGAGAAASLLASQRAAALDPQDLDLGDVVQNTNAPTRATYNGGAAPRAGFEFAASNAPLARSRRACCHPTRRCSGTAARRCRTASRGSPNSPTASVCSPTTTPGAGRRYGPSRWTAAPCAPRRPAPTRTRSALSAPVRPAAASLCGSFSTDVESIGALYGLSFGGNALFALGAIYGARIRGATADLFLGPTNHAWVETGPTDAH